MQYSIIYKSGLNSELRLDAEYYQPKYLALEAIIKAKQWDIIGDFSYVTDGIHTSIDFDNESNIKLISAKSPKENTFDLSANGNISEKQHLENERTSLQENDVIISTVGTIGNCSVVDRSILPANCDRHVGIIRIKKDYYPRFISTFFLCKYGRFQTERNITGNVQPNLFIYAIKKMVVPKLNDDYQRLIEQLVVNAHNEIEKSKESYVKAENILLEELGLKDWKPSHKLTYVKMFKDTIESNRFDAEYFQPKYDEIINAITSYSGGYDLAAKILKIKDKNFTPEVQEYKYIELSNIGVNGEITGCTVDMGDLLPTRARRIVNTGDVLVSSIEGSLSSIAMVDGYYNNSLCSTGFYVVNSEIIKPETMLVFFKCVAGQMQLKRGCSGTILTAINKEAFSNIVIPKVDSKIEEKIYELIAISTKQRQIAKEYLEIAKKSVEIAIEQNEEISSEWVLREIEQLEEI